MTKFPEVPVDQLRRTVDERRLSFQTTEEVPPLEILEGIIGQERAVKAIQFGLQIKNPGYNVYMSGLVGTGKVTYAQNSVKRLAKAEQNPNDWCYVNNFSNPSQPIAISLPPGIGQMFHDDIQELVEQLKVEIPKAFSGEDYERQKEALIKELQQLRSDLMDDLNNVSQELGIIPQWTSNGFVGVPLVDDKPVAPDDYQKLDPEDKEQIDRKLKIIQERAAEAVHKLQQGEKMAKERLKGLDSNIGMFTVGHVIAELKDKYKQYPDVVKHVEATQKEILANINDFKPLSAEEEQNPFLIFRKSMADSTLDKYKVNLLVNNKHTEGAPVIVESNPTYYNLVGRVEYETRMGTASTDFMMIKPGALHRANGGYLILHAKDVLTNFQAWPALKRALQTRKLYIENMGEQFGMVTMASLKPDPIPVNVKVILIGNPHLYQLLYTYDEDFSKLFKIKADFDTEMEFTEQNINKLASFISSYCRRENLLHFDRSAVAKVAQYSSRLAGAQEKLTTRFSEVVKILCEANAWAVQDQAPVVSFNHVKRAIEEKNYRANLYEQKLREMFDDGKFLLDVNGSKVGQINGLAVLSVGSHTFGKPSRITCNTFLGRSGIVNIERETKMSGQIHSKGVLTLSGYLGQQYGRNQPLALSASLTFEQMYDGVDGDSASSAELYAILSSLSELPLRQDVAVTGSVNQKGEIQPVGGVTQKIEGFYEVCKLKGLTGNQGVMIPCQNIDSLVLDDEVCEAVKQGQFHIYPVRTIDEGIQILTGVKPGARKNSGSFTRGTVHELVSKKLKQFAKTMIQYSKTADGKSKADADEEPPKSTIK